MSARFQLRRGPIRGMENAHYSHYVAFVARRRYALPSHGAVGEYDGAAERDAVPYGTPYGVAAAPYGAEDCADVAIDVGTDVGQ
jgi:hypothetical protein